MSDREDQELSRIVHAVITNLRSLPNADGNLQNLRNFSSSGATAEVGTSAVATSTTEQELRRSFCIPRGRQPQPQRQLANQYSNSRNYSASRTGKGKGKQPLRSGSGRFSTASSKLADAPATLKDVCLLPSPEWQEVPRRKAKADLMKAGLFIDAWPFPTALGERELRMELKNLFSEHLADEGEEIG